MVASSLPVLHLPELLADVWRIAFYLLACAAIAHAVAFVMIERERSRLILMAAVIVMLSSWIVINVLRWGEVVYWLGLPVQTVAAALVIWGVQVWLHEPHPAGSGASSSNR